MFKFKAKDAITIKQPSGTIIDGKDVYVSTAAKARIMDMDKRDIDLWGTVRNGKVFLVPAPVLVTQPAKIEYSGKTYDIQQIKVCRDLDGKLVGCRCLVVM